MDVLRFHLVDYIVMGIFLVVSSAIGFYYGVIKNPQTTDEYLLGGRQMHLLPVAISTMVTYQSAISILGYPNEIYTYDTFYGLMFFIALPLAHLVQAFTIVPLLHPLKLTSTFEYFGQRYHSRAVQLLGTAMGMLNTLLYLGIVLLAPALALEAVAGFPLWVSIVVVGVIGTVYTSLGGMRTVIWTDVFQFIVLYGGLIVILILGANEIGGMKTIFETAYKGGRINFSTIDPDPRVRHTVWGLIVGGTFNWFPNICNQSAVQRICSMRTTRDAKISSLLNVPLVMIYGLILTLVGLLLYSYYALEECDPYFSGNITNRNQLVPYFVMHVFAKFPGLAGIFIAAMFSGALSSLSSGINSMAANTIQDVLVNVLKDASQFKKTLLAKVIVLIYGVLAVSLAYAFKSLTGPVTQISLSAFGSVGGPMAGILFLGAMFPQANWIGALAGGIIGVGINMWIAVGSILYGAKAPISPVISTAGCNNSSEPTTSMWTNGSSTSTFSTITTVYIPMFGNMTNTSDIGPSAADDDGPRDFVIYDVSYIYIGLIGFVITFVVGLFVSVITGMDRGDPTDSRYIFSCMRKFWRIGYTTVTAPGVYTVTKAKQDGTKEQVPVQITQIKSRELTWYKNDVDEPS